MTMPYSNQDLCGGDADHYSTADQLIFIVLVSKEHSLHILLCCKYISDITYLHMQYIFSLHYIIERLVIQLLKQLSCDWSPTVL